MKNKKTGQKGKTQDMGFQKILFGQAYSGEEEVERKNQGEKKKRIRFNSGLMTTKETRKKMGKERI